MSPKKKNEAVALVPAVNPHTPKPGGGLVALAAEAAEVERLIIALAEKNAGEIDMDLEAYLKEIETKLAEKPDAYKYVIDKLSVASELLHHQATQFLNAAAAMDSTVERMYGNIKAAMELRGWTEVKGKTWRFALQNTQKRLVVDELQMTEHQKKVETAVTTILLTAKAYRDKSKAAYAGGAGKTLAELTAAVDHYEALVSDSYVGVVIQVKPNNAKIKADTEAGKAPFGATLEGGKALREYIVKAGG